METFISAHAELAEADRQMMLGWHDVVEGVFEIRERDREAIIAVNLIDELTYRVYSNAGPVALASMEPGCFMIARIDSAASSLDADVAARTPAFSVPGDLASAPTVALACAPSLPLRSA